MTAAAAAVDRVGAAYLDTPSTTQQDTHATRLQRRDETKLAMSTTLRSWAHSAARADVLPAWAAEPIVVADFVQLELGRPALRVAGGSSMMPAEWIGRRAAAIDECRVVRAFRDATCGRWTVAPSSCHVRTCPDCEAQRQSRALAIYARVAGERMTDPRFVTLTITNVPRGELRAGLRRLRKLVAQLLRRGLVKGGRCRYRKRCGAVRSVDVRGRPRLCPHPAGDHLARTDGTWTLGHEYRARCEARDPAAGHGAARGGIVSVEVTYNELTDTWHPHAHLLLDGPFLPWAELRNAWHELTSRDGGTPAWIVDVRRVKADPDGSLAGGIREVVKYATKPSKALVETDGGAVLAELLLALRGQRLVSAFGSLHGIPAAELEPDVDDRDTVRIADPDDEFRGWRLPRLCPHVDPGGGQHVATWTDATWTGRADCQRVRAGPNHSALVWRGP